MDATVYQFEVQSEFLAGALDIFAQFFVAPLFSESATEREMRAVSHSLKYTHVFALYVHACNVL